MDKYDRDILLHAAGVASGLSKLLTQIAEKTTKGANHAVKDVNLVVTKDGIPFADQREGVAAFKAACLASSADKPERNPAQTTEAPKAPTFENRLVSLINEFSIENDCNVPDFILGRYMENALGIFTAAVNADKKWHGTDFGSGLIQSTVTQPEQGDGRG